MRNVSITIVCGPLVLCLAGCNADPASHPMDDAGIGDMAAALPAKVAATWSALHYDVAFDLTTHVARTDVQLRISAPGNCVTIGFRPLAVSEVAFDGTAAEPGDTAVDP